MQSFTTSDKSSAREHSFRCQTEGGAVQLPNEIGRLIRIIATDAVAVIRYSELQFVRRKSGLSAI